MQAVPAYIHKFSRRRIRIYQQLHSFLHSQGGICRIGPERRLCIPRFLQGKRSVFHASCKKDESGKDDTGNEKVMIFFPQTCTLFLF
jgi:hypothetical protein